MLENNNRPKKRFEGKNPVGNRPGETQKFIHKKIPFNIDGHTVLLTWDEIMGYIKSLRDAPGSGCVPDDAITVTNLEELRDQKKANNFFGPLKGKTENDIPED